MNKIAKNSLVLISSQIAAKIIAFIFVIMLARLLGSEGFGQYSFVIAFVMILNILVNFGMDNLLIREIARDKNNYSLYLANTLLVKLVFSISAVALIYCLFGILDVFNDNVKTGYILIFSLTVFFSSAQQTLWSVGDAFEEMQYHSMLFVVLNILKSVAGVALLLGGFGLAAIFKGLLLAEALGAGLGFAVIFGRFGVPAFNADFKFCLSLVKSSVPLGLFQIFINFYLRIDTIMLSVIIGDTAAGLYNAGHNLMLTLLFIPTSIVIAVFPSISRYFGSSGEKLKSIYDRTFKYLFMIGLPIAVGTTLLAERLIRLFYGGQYMNAAVVLKILIWALAIFFIDALLCNTLIAVNREKEAAAALGAGTMINLALNFALIPAMSFTGAAASKVFSEVFVCAICLFMIRRYLDFFPVPAACVKPVSAGAVMGAFIFCFKAAPLLPLVALACAVYLCVLYFAGAFNREELDSFKLMLRKSG